MVWSNEKVIVDSKEVKYQERTEATRMMILQINEERIWNDGSEWER